jgi:HPt (histidine-containing phosphotransfer) domain-containing protein
MLNALRQRLADYFRERRIHAIRQQIRDAYEAGDKAGVTRHAHALLAECDARSPGEVARMERRLLDSLDPHARAVLERAQGVRRA